MWNYLDLLLKKERHVEMVRIFSTWQCFMLVAQIFSMRFDCRDFVLPNQTRKKQMLCGGDIMCFVKFTNSEIKRQ